MLQDDVAANATAALKQVHGTEYVYGPGAATLCKYCTLFVAANKNKKMILINRYTLQKIIVTVNYCPDTVIPASAIFIALEE